MTRCKCHKDIITIGDNIMCDPYKRPLANKASIIKNKIIRLPIDARTEMTNLHPLVDKTYNCFLKREKMRKYRLFYKLNLKLIG